MFNAIANFKKYFPVRMSVLVMAGVLVFFLLLLIVMLRFSYATVEKESLEKAQQRLNITTSRIDNLLYRTAVATRNIQWYVEQRLDKPGHMMPIARGLVQNNPDMVGCAIAFEPNYYPEMGEMYYTYAYRSIANTDSVVITHDPFIIEPGYRCPTPYPAHNWYVIPKNANEICWIRPHSPGDTFLSTIVTCGVPIHDKTGRVIGVIGVDIAVDRLSRAVLETKPFPNSYSVMLGVKGTYLIHPDTTKLFHTLVDEVVKKEPDPRLGDLVKSMLNGEVGCREVTIGGVESYVLFRPLNEKHWSACIVCPKSDIFASNEKTKNYMIGIMFVCAFLIFAFCMLFFNHQLEPLDNLSQSAKAIAKGDFSEMMPYTRRKDELGVLQNSFVNMQKSCYDHIMQLHRMSEQLHDQHEELNRVYEEVRAADNLKSNLIYKMADQMIPPAKAIDSVVTGLKKSSMPLQPKTLKLFAQKVLEYTKEITDLLDQIFKKNNHANATTTA